uniref:Adenosine 3'-phospho 5'-phosphosulfate transporter 2 n=1 Tax=Ciona savignyi TaxID=51511 RepID=H2YAE5_CIOSA
EEKRICGLNLNKLPRSLQLILCVVAVFSVYLIHSYCQEWIFRTNMKKYGLFVTLVQFGFYTIFGFIEKISTEMEERRVPLKTYAGIAMLTIGTIAFSNTSLGYLNYPTQIMFKSSKLIPVMIGGILIQGKTFSIIDFISCLLMTIGLITFTLTDQKVSPNFDPTGIVLISLALCSDAAIGNIQEVTFKKHKSSNAELVLYSFGIGFLILLLVNSMVGDVFKAVIVLKSNINIIFALFLFSFTGYIGILFVLHLVRTFGALLAVTVTTCRKAVSMVLSFVFFAKPFSIMYVWGGLLVLVGISVNIYSKNKSKVDELVSKVLKRIRESEPEKSKTFRQIS